MKLFSITTSEMGAIESFHLTGGVTLKTVHNVYNYLKTLDADRYYGEGVHKLAVALESVGFKFRKPSILSTGEIVVIMIGKVVLSDISKWELGLKVDQDEGMLDGFTRKDGKIPGSPTLLVIDDYKAAVRGEGYQHAQGSKISFMEALLSSSKIPTKGFKPAYRGGLISSPASSYKVYDNVISYDIASSYPWTAATTLMPKGKTKSVTKEQIAKLQVKDGAINLGKDVGFIGLFKFKGLKRKSWVKIPSLRKSDEDYCENPEFDKVGLLSCDSIRMAMCPHDLRVMWIQYTWESIEIEILEAHKLQKLPDSIRGFLGGLYTTKQSKTGAERLRAKVAINSVIGCWGNDPFKAALKQELHEGSIRLTYPRNLEPHWAKYSGVDGDGFLKSGRRPWDFRWAVYACAAARLRIAESEYFLQKNGMEVLYCDTDSIKFIGDRAKAQRIFGKFNERAAAVNEEFDLPEGMGEWVDESAAYAKAYFRGPKFYATEDSQGNREAHVSGLYRDDAAKMIAAVRLEDLAAMDEIIVSSSRPDNAIVKDDPFGAAYQEIPRTMEFRYSRTDSTIHAL